MHYTVVNTIVVSYLHILSMHTCMYVFPIAFAVIAARSVSFV